MKRVLILFAMLFAVSAAPTEQEYQHKFDQFVDKYNKEYSKDEYQLRFNIFKDNVDRIEKHNSEESDWTLEVNEFADMTWHEFKDGRIMSFPFDPSPNSMVDGNEEDVDVPDTWDWTEKGAVTPVKNQEQCGSCWAFSAVGSMEGASFVNSGKLTSLSVQHLVDCSQSFGNEGCAGGLMDAAFKYVMKNGICSEKDYPYTAKDGTCKKCAPSVRISSFVDVPSNNEKALQQAVYKQPVAVAVEADQMGWQFYGGGIMSGSCGTNLDHGVLAVGWGEKNGKPYWKVKNSWGGIWGEKGYILLARSISKPEGQCGIAMQASYPVLHSESALEM